VPPTNARVYQMRVPEKRERRGAGARQETATAHVQRGAVGPFPVDASLKEKFPTSPDPYWTVQYDAATMRSVL